ncbi:MAG TPA: VWA domain-containing protein [Bryobacteraceae bacterium]|nr:VWA domain-containing protein [Bryobacteraceae bacterium]
MALIHNPIERAAVLVFLPVILLMPLAAQQQEKPPEEAMPSISVNVSLVNILASVHDRHGGLIGNLSKDDFTVFEDGKQQTIKYFTRETDLPLTIGLLIDVSASQRNLLDIEKRAAHQFFSQVLRKKDEAFLISFGEDSELLQDYTNSPRLLQGGLSQLQINSGASGMGPGPVPTISQPRGTVLYDAVYLAAHEKLRGEVGRKVIVLITDGVDQGSKLRIEDAIEAAQKADAVVYSIDYADPSAYGLFSFGVSDSALQKMSGETGGRVFKVDRKHTLEDAFTELQAEMRSQYAIAYTSTNPDQDGTFRKLIVKVADKNLKVQVRKGYYATKPEPS